MWMMGHCLKFLWLVCDSKEGEGEGEEVERAEAQEASELIPKIWQRLHRRHRHPLVPPHP